MHDLIERLQLRPHPEGGFYRERHRSALSVQRTDGQERSAFTVIDFLLPAGVTSRWHRLSGAEESWHHAAGAPLELWSRRPDGGDVLAVRLGPLDQAFPEQYPVHVIPPNWWQAARSLGAWTLVNCCVAPGFDFADFLCEDDPE